MAGKTRKKGVSAAMLGSAFLMATSSIGPGCFNNMSLLIAQYRGWFLPALAAVILLDIVVQLNVWQVCCVSGKSGTELGNMVFHGWGYVLTVLLGISAMAFNIGTVGGGALGFYAMCGMDQTLGAILTGALAIVLFWSKNLNRALDRTAELRGLIVIGGIIIVLISAFPAPETIAAELSGGTSLLLLATPIITEMGSAAGGYIPLSGAQRLVDQGITGVENLRDIRRSALMGVGIGEGMRMLLALAMLGVVYAGGTVDTSNPAASLFRAALGMAGYRIFGVVILFASMNSLVGCSYTLAALLKPFGKIFENNFRWVVTVIAAVSTVLMVTIGQPAAVLLIAGVIAGLSIPFVLGTVLLASRRKSIVGDVYRHSPLLTAAGIAVALFLGYYGVRAIPSLAQLF